MSLAARIIEQAGIPTVIIGSALDIVEFARVPRYLFTDFPLGNPCGKPYERRLQEDIFSRALSLFDAAEEPETTWGFAAAWEDGVSWRSRYAAVRPDNRAELLAVGEARRASQRAKKTN